MGDTSLNIKKVRSSVWQLEKEAGTPALRTDTGVGRSTVSSVGLETPFSVLVSVIFLNIELATIII